MNKDIERLVRVLPQVAAELQAGLHDIVRTVEDTRSAVEELIAEAKPEVKESPEPTRDEMVEALKKFWRDKGQADVGGWERPGLVNNITTDHIRDAYNYVQGGGQ